MKLPLSYPVGPRTDQHAALAAKGEVLHIHHAGGRPEVFFLRFCECPTTFQDLVIELAPLRVPEINASVRGRRQIFAVWTQSQSSYPVFPPHIFLASSHGPLNVLCRFRKPARRVGILIYFF